MGIDIRMPIGLMFTVFGLIITVYGVITNSNTAMYAKSLNININIWMGVFMLVFGLIMLFFARRKKTVKE
jgi:hypothetical protein